jgi:type IV pilus assembly protein PilO
MPDLQTTRRNLKIAYGALIAVDLMAVVLLFSPLVGSERSRREQQDQLWKELQAKTHQVEPLRGLDKKIVLAKQQIDGFYKDRLPAQNSAISEALGKVAAESGVQMGTVKYSVKDEQPVGLEPLQIDADFSGGYLQLVKFVNALEREKVFFIVDGVDLAGEQQPGNVRLKLKLETYLRMSA